MQNPNSFSASLTGSYTGSGRSVEIDLLYFYDSFVVGLRTFTEWADPQFKLVVPRLLRIRILLKKERNPNGNLLVVE